MESQITGIGKLKVLKKFTCVSSELEIKWIEIGGNKPQFDVVPTRLIGINVSAVVETIHDGGIIYGPLSGEFFQTVENSPQVRDL